MRNNSVLDRYIFHIDSCSHTAINSHGENFYNGCCYNNNCPKHKSGKWLHLLPENKNMRNNSVLEKLEVQETQTKVHFLCTLVN
jgi:G:T-mismatch repair DNA endonuclease (very short patch repair protein)